MPVMTQEIELPKPAAVRRVSGALHISRQWANGLINKNLAPVREFDSIKMYREQDVERLIESQRGAAE